MTPIKQRSSSQIFEKYALKTLHSFPKESIILLNGDLDPHLFKYYQTCEGVREDLNLIEIDHMNKKWFITMQSHHFPNVKFPKRKRGRLTNFLNENLVKSKNNNIFICGENVLQYDSNYETKNYGMCEKVFTKDYVWKSEGSFPSSAPAKTKRKNEKGGVTVKVTMVSSRFGEGEGGAIENSSEEGEGVEEDVGEMERYFISSSKAIPRLDEETVDWLKNYHKDSFEYWISREIWTRNVFVCNLLIFYATREESLELGNQNILIFHAVEHCESIYIAHKNKDPLGLIGYDHFRSAGILFGHFAALLLNEPLAKENDGDVQRLRDIVNICWKCGKWRGN